MEANLKMTQMLVLADEARRQALNQTIITMPNEVKKNSQ